MAETLFDAVGPADTHTVDYAGRASILTVERIDRAAGRILLRSRVDGEVDDTCWFTRQSAGIWRWPPEDGHAPPVAAEVAAWMEEHWRAGGGQDG